LRRIPDYRHKTGETHGFRYALFYPWASRLVLLGLSIAWGWLTQKTGSLWGSALFHAGADLLIILPIFSGLGAM